MWMCSGEYWFRKSLCDAAALNASEHNLIFVLMVSMMLRAHIQHSTAVQGAPNSISCSLNTIYADEPFWILFPNWDPNQSPAPKICSTENKVSFKYVAKVHMRTCRNGFQTHRTSGSTHPNSQIFSFLFKSSQAFATQDLLKRDCVFLLYQIYVVIVLLFFSRTEFHTQWYCERKKIKSYSVQTQAACH